MCAVERAVQSGSVASDSPQVAGDAEPLELGGAMPRIRTLKPSHARTFRYFRVAHSFLALPLPWYAKMVYVALCHHVDAGEDSPSIGSLASDAGCSVSLVHRAFMRREAVGVLQIRSGRRPGGTNVYTLHDPPGHRGFP